jgi:steroid 5-alpha reductase family enzyme
MTDDARTDDPALTVSNHHGRTGQRHGVALGEGQIRRIFPVFVLGMWVTAGVWIAHGDWSRSLTLLAVESLVVCTLVFVNFVWVFSLSYGAAVVLLNATILVVVGRSPAALVVGGLLVLYGVRLFAFASTRFAHASFAGRVAGQKAAHRSLPFPIKVVLWLQTCTLFLFGALTTYVLARDAIALSPVIVAGALVLLAGIVLEGVADEQKQREKRLHPGALVITGLWSRSRHPNYLGEIVVQSGVMVCAVGAWLSSGGAWTLVAMVLAPLYIVLLMVSATTGAELSLFSRHGEDPAFQEYAARTGVLLPRRS